MTDSKGRSEDMKDKVVDKGKKTYGKATGNRSKGAEGKTQSLGSDIKEEAHDLDDGVKDKFFRKDENK